MSELDYEKTSIFRLGKIYKEIGDTLMDPETTIEELAAMGHKYGVTIRMELVPDDNSPANGE